MKLTNSTDIKPVPQMATIGDLKGILSKDGELSTGDTNALIEIGSGVGVVAAMENHGTYDKKASPQSNQGNFRSRLATALLNIVRSLMTPVSEKRDEEIEKNRVAEATKTDKEKAKAWVDGGSVGRRPKALIHSSEKLVKAAYNESLIEARKAHDLKSNGRVPVSISRDYHNTLVEKFTENLKAIKTELYDTIENIVAEYIGEFDEKNFFSNILTDAAKNADKTAREAIGAGEKGRIAGELVPEYNKAATASFRDSLREIKETQGSLPDNMDNLTEAYLSTYDVEDTVTEAKNKDKGKEKKKAPKPSTKTKKGGKKAKNDSEPVSGEVTKSDEQADADDEAEANAAVAGAASAE